ARQLASAFPQHQEPLLASTAPVRAPRSSPVPISANIERRIPPGCRPEWPCRILCTCYLNSCLSLTNGIARKPYKVRASFENPERGCVVFDQPQHTPKFLALLTCSTALRLVFDTAALHFQKRFQVHAPITEMR